MFIIYGTISCITISDTSYTCTHVGTREKSLVYCILVVYRRVIIVSGFW